MVPVSMKGLWVVMLTLVFYLTLNACHPLCSGLSLALLHSCPNGGKEGFAQGSLLELFLLPPSTPTSRSDGGLCHSGRAPLVVDMTWAF